MFTAILQKNRECLLIVVFLCSAQVGGQHSVNDTCVHSSGDPARCRSTSQCPEATILMDRDFKPILCGGSHEGEELICCRENTSTSQPLLLTLSENHNDSRQNVGVSSGEKGNSSDDEGCADSACLKSLGSQRMPHRARAPIFLPSNVYNSPQNFYSSPPVQADGFGNIAERPKPYFRNRVGNNLKALFQHNRGRNAAPSVPWLRPTTQRPVQPAPLFYYTQDDPEPSSAPIISFSEFKNDPTNRHYNDDSDSEELHGDISNMRVSQLMCTNYSLSATSVSLNPHGLLLRPSRDNFRVNICSKKSVSLIFGGESAKLGEFPHMAALGYFASSNDIHWDCGGSLISDYFVLTAAHCVKFERRPVVVRLGEHDVASSEDGANPKDYRIAEFIRHHDYDDFRYYNDIALLRLKERVHFHASIRPACLPSENLTFSSAIASGWGLLLSFDRSDVLQKVSLNPIADARCTRSFRAEIFPGSRLAEGLDYSSQMCYGEDGDKDTASGDSGGPLQVPTENCNYYVVGITSVGKRRTGVYTRVQHYLDWIESKVWPTLRI